MKKTNFRLRLCITLLVLNLVFIWGNSLFPAQASAAISGWIWELLGDFTGGDMTPGGAVGDGPLRKAAHFIEFAGLGMVLLWIMVLTGKQRFLAFAGGFGVACVDETIQMFVPGRGPAIGDVLLDSAGVLTGLLLFLLIRHLRRNQSLPNGGI